MRSTLGHWTFVPNPLPPELAYDSALVRILSDADRSLGELAGAGKMLPNPLLLIRPFLRREAVLSSRIEGTITELGQLFLFEAEPDQKDHPEDAGEVRNYVRALEYGLGAIQSGAPFSLQLIREIHRILLNDVRGATNNRASSVTEACASAASMSKTLVSSRHATRNFPRCSTISCNF